MRSTSQLSQTALDSLLAALDEEREAAGSKYLLLRRNLVTFFEVRGISHADDAADEVLNRLAKKFASGEKFIGVGTYALGIARFVALEFNRNPEIAASDSMPETVVQPTEGQTDEREQKLRCLENCLRKLPTETRRIIVGYYQGEKSRKIENRQKLAESLGIALTALRNRAVRLRDKLEECITECVGRLG